VVLKGVVAAGLAGIAASVALVALAQPRTLVTAAAAPAVAVPPSAEADALFRATCQACHGAGGAGGDRAPALVNTQRLRTLPDAQIKTIIRGGTPGGMPPFPLPDAQLDALVAWIRSNNQSAAQAQRSPEQVEAGRRFFFAKGECSTCHMVRGEGGVNGPDLSSIAARSTVREIEGWLDHPAEQTGTKKAGNCPGWAFCPDYQWSVVRVRLKSGEMLRGFSRNQAEHDLQLQTLDGKLRMLTDKDYVSIEREPGSIMPPLKATAEERRDLLAYLSSLDGVPLGPLQSRPAPVSKADTNAVDFPKKGEWPSYNGGPQGNRYSDLDQINTRNVSQLEAKWTFTPGGTGLQNTPVVVDGVMYVTGAQTICALDARTGRSVWCSARNSGQDVPAGGVVETPRPAAAAQPRAAAAPAPAAGARPFAGVATGTGPNRGVAVLRDLVYFVSDDAYLVALNKVTGSVVWTVPLTDPNFKGRYYNTAAPLVVGDLIVSGVAGGDTPLRGFLVAFKATTGELAWRLWTIPLPGEPGSETWRGDALPTGGGATWTTGSYDPGAKILYWAVGNPYPPTDGAQRGGANLYSNAVLAIDPANGKVKWHFQFTPHDLHDWDAATPLVLADAKWKGQDRKLLLHGDRNGFFYALDRITGQYLTGAAFVKRLTWASGLSPQGVPITTENNVPTDEGTYTCPNVRGATNWYAQSFNPGTGLFYVMAAEDCGIYRRVGSTYAGRPDPQNPGERFLRALNIETGQVAWEKKLVGSQEANYSGVLTTAGGLAFHGEIGGAFAAVDAKTGETLWYFRTNDNWRATAMSYLLDGKQYVAVAAGSNIITFALRD
jgi:PQQ-dependent dehydrogenase (methanol/ethanol family)